MLRDDSNSLLHADQLEVAAKVPGIQPGDGQPVAKAGHRGLEVGLVKGRVQARRLVDGGVHVGPDEGDGGARDAAALVRDLDGDVLVAGGDNDLGDGEGVVLLAVPLDDGAERVLERLEEHVAQVAGHVHEAEVRFAHELHLGRVEQAVVVLAHEARVVDGLEGELAHVGLGADDADVGRVRGRFGRLLHLAEGNVLADQHADADARHVEAVEEALDRLVNLQPLLLALPFEHALGWAAPSARAPLFVPNDAPTVVTTLSCRRLMRSSILANWRLYSAISHGHSLPSSTAA